MKIAIFTDTFSPQINGVTKTLDRLLEYFEQKGIDYLVFAPDTPAQQASCFQKKIRRIPAFNFFLGDKKPAKHSALFMLRQISLPFRRLQKLTETLSLKQWLPVCRL